VRTAWLYGAYGPSFVATMRRLEATRDTVDVVDDQHGQPTWTIGLAAQVEALVTADAPPGIYHRTSSGETTWHALAREVFTLAAADPERMHPTTSAAFVRRAAAVVQRARSSSLGRRGGWHQCGTGAGHCTPRRRSCSAEEVPSTSRPTTRHARQYHSASAVSTPAHRLPACPPARR
jgi:hypothetical protein